MCLGVVLIAFGWHTIGALIIGIGIGTFVAGFAMTDGLRCDIEFAKKLPAHRCGV